MRIYYETVPVESNRQNHEKQNQIQTSMETYEARYKMVNGFIYGETPKCPVLVLFRLIKESLLFTRIGIKRL